MEQKELIKTLWIKRWNKKFIAMTKIWTKVRIRVARDFNIEWSLLKFIFLRFLVFSRDYPKTCIRFVFVNLKLLTFIFQVVSPFSLLCGACLCFLWFSSSSDREINKSNKSSDMQCGDTKTYKIKCELGPSQAIVLFNSVLLIIFIDPKKNGRSLSSVLSWFRSKRMCHVQI